MSEIFDKIKIKFDKIRCTHANSSLNSFSFCNSEIPDEKMQKCSILILIFHSGNDLNVIFTIRNFNLKKYPGEICFPGGKFDSHIDKSYEDCAIREASEEIGINKQNIRIVCNLCPILTMVGHYIVPIVGLVCRDNQFDCNETLDIIQSLTPNTSEVESIFWTPLKYFSRNFDSNEIFNHITTKLDFDEKFLETVKFIDNVPSQYLRVFISFSHFLSHDVKPNGEFIYGINATIFLLVLFTLENDEIEQNKKANFPVRLDNFKAYFDQVRKIGFLLYKNYLFNEDLKLKLKAKL